MAYRTNVRKRRMLYARHALCMMLAASPRHLACQLVHHRRSSSSLFSLASPPACLAASSLVRKLPHDRARQSLCCHPNSTTAMHQRGHRAARGRDCPHSTASPGAADKRHAEQCSAHRIEIYACSEGYHAERVRSARRERLVGDRRHKAVEQPVLRWPRQRRASGEADRARPPGRTTGRISLDGATGDRGCRRCIEAARAHACLPVHAAARASPATACVEHVLFGLPARLLQNPHPR